MKGIDTMRKEHHAIGERRALKDLRPVRAVSGREDVSRALASSGPDRVRVYDPEVKFISLPSSLHPAVSAEERLTSYLPR